MTQDAMPTDVDDEALATLRDVIGGWLMAHQLEGTSPVVAASDLFQVLYEVVEKSMGRNAVRTALLMVFEKSHDQPTTFAERQRAKDTLDQISNHRRKLEGKPHLVLPSDDGQPPSL